MLEPVTRLSSYGIVTNGSQILLCRLSPGTSAPGQWTLPGGGLEFGESPEETLRREIGEETGLSAGEVSLLNVASEVEVFRERTHHLIRFFYRVHDYTGEIRNELSGTTDRCEWIEMDHLTELLAVDIVRYAMKLV